MHARKQLIRIAALTLVAALLIAWWKMAPRRSSIMEGAERLIPALSGGLPLQMIKTGYMDSKGVYGVRIKRGMGDVDFIGYAAWGSGTVHRLEPLSAKIRATKGGFPEISPDGLRARWTAKRRMYTSTIDGKYVRLWPDLRFTNQNVSSSWLSDSRYWVQIWKHATAGVAELGGPGEYRALIRDHQDPSRIREVSLGNLGGCGPVFALPDCKLLILNRYQSPGDRFLAAIADPLASRPSATPIEFRAPNLSIERNLLFSQCQSADLRRIGIVAQHRNLPESEIVTAIRSMFGVRSNRASSEFVTLIGDVVSRELTAITPPEAGKDLFQFFGWTPDGRRRLVEFDGWLWAVPLED